MDSFKLISFDSKIWQSEKIADNLMNIDTKNKVVKTKQIMEFILSKISSGDVKVAKEPGLYALNIKDNIKNITSIIGAIRYDEKKILFPNEAIHPDKLNSYKEIFNRYKMQINPVLTFYKNGCSIKSLLNNIVKREPKIDVKIKDTQYKLWAINNPIDLINIKNNIAKIDRIYIADGHHRFSIFQEAPRKAATKIMISLTDAESVCMKSYHRVIIGEIDDNWMQRILKYCIVVPLSHLSSHNDIIIYFKNEQKYKVIFKPEVLANLPMYFAVDNIIFKETFEINRSNREIFPLPATISPLDAHKIFDLYKESSVIVFIPELDISEFFEIVDNGEKLPPTSTWFEPKIVDGFLMSHFY